MRRHFFLILLGAGFAASLLPLRAVPPRPVAGPPTPEELTNGQALAERLRSSAPAENSRIHGRLIIDLDDASREIPIDCNVAVTATNWVTEYQTGGTSGNGPEHLVVTHCASKPSQYLYARAGSPSAPLPKLKTLAPSDADIPLAGSDFSLSDLGLEFLHWPVQRQMKGEMRLGQPCYVLESSRSGDGIVRIRSDIDEESGSPLIADAYDSDGRLVKEYSLHASSFKKVNGRWQVEKMEISNKKTGSHTELKFDLNK
jgi:hypothetical protein